MIIIKIIVAFLLICLSVLITSLAKHLFNDEALIIAINLVIGGFFGWYFNSICEYIDWRINK